MGAHIIKVRLFLPCLLNCFCDESELGGTPSQAGVSCEKVEFAVFEIKVIAKVQNFLERLSALCSCCCCCCCFFVQLMYLQSN